MLSYIPMIVIPKPVTPAQVPLDTATAL